MNRGRQIFSPSRTARSYVLPVVLHIANLSQCNGNFRDVLKQAYVTPLLKNVSLDNDDVSNYRPVSNLFSSKVIKKRVHIQIDMYLCENFFNGQF